MRHETDDADASYRHWHLDRTLNISHILTTIAIAGSVFVYASSMDKRVAVLEEKITAQAQANQQAQQDIKALASDVKYELRLLRSDIMEAMKEGRK